MAQKQPKFALVIGNANYEEERLENTVNDATDMAKALQDIGFEVTLLQNQDLRSMENAIAVFSQQLRKGGVGVFYYAGHGVQVQGENYLIPLKAQLQNEKDARYEAVALGKVLNAMEEARNQVNIVIIDACRNNPFYRRWRSRGRGSDVRGLAAVFHPSGIIIAYATREGNTAEDGVGQRNSPFTSALLENIKKPNIDVQLMFRRVSTVVKQKTNAAKQHWTEGNLEGDEFYLNPQSTAITPQIPTPVATPSPQPTPKPTVAVIPSPKPTPSNPPSQPRSTLISSTTGVDYTPLRQLLQQKKWEEADRQTWELIQIATIGLITEGMSYRGDFYKDLPCKDLDIIEQLWLKSSGGKFGFSIQLAIYENAGNPIASYNENAYRRFGDKVGRRENGYWKNFDEIQSVLDSSTLSALPQGYLPSCGYSRAGGGWVWHEDRIDECISMFSLAKACEIKLSNAAFQTPTAQSFPKRL